MNGAPSRLIIIRDLLMALVWDVDGGWTHSYGDTEHSELIISQIDTGGGFLFFCWVDDVKNEWMLQKIM